MHTLRVILVGIGISLAGMMMGAVAGVTAASIVAVVMAGPVAMLGPLPFLGGVFGALLGMLLAPIAAFTFLRHVPLWRWFTEVTIGTIVSGVVAALVHLDPNLVLGAGMVGFFAAGIRLARRFEPTQASEDRAAEPGAADPPVQSCQRAGRDSAPAWE